MASQSFVHLHLHTQYSLLDGAIKFSDLFRMAKHYEMPAVAITDHGNLFGALEFYQHAKEAGVKPIIGCEVYYTVGSRFDRGEEVKNNKKKLHHLTLLAQDREGYKNLCKMVSAAYLEGFYYKPRVDRELLERFSKGLICFSGCLASETSHLIFNEQEEELRSRFKWYSDLFEDRYFLEIQENGLSEQNLVNKKLIKYSNELGIPLIATNDCHYLKQEDAAAQDILVCIQTGKTLSDSDRLRFGTDELYFKSPDVIRKQFNYCQEACDNTIKIADRCKIEFSFGRYFLPKFDIPKKEETIEEYFEDLSIKGLETRLKVLRDLGEIPDEKIYQERLKTELEIIKAMGFAGYFLIVWDFIHFAKSKNIPVGPGRGSVAGSLVAYALAITDVDPIQYNLLFERFLNPERISMPDMDIDFCMDRRGEVIKYVTEKYGEKKVAQIITFGKMQAKAAIRDVGRALDFQYSEVDKIAKLVPNQLNISIEKALDQEPRLLSLTESDGRVRHLIKMAQALEGLVRHASIHAAGIVISEEPMEEYLPLFRGKEGEVVTQFDMKNVEKIGLIKFDFLGLTTLTVIQQATEMIKDNKDKGFDIGKIKFNDPAIFDLLSRGDTLGVFQLESSGMRNILTRLKPNCFEDITAVNAMYRPGPLGSGMVDDFIDRKHGKISIKYELPQLEEILKDTYGVILYQEQVMKIANVLASYSMGEADLLRRAMGKKQTDEMRRQKDRFISGATTKGIQFIVAERIFDLMAKFAEYGFNKSHSTAYALVAYQTAFLKAHFPHEFFAALLTAEMENSDKITAYIQDAREHKIEILPPDVNESQWHFSVVDGSIRSGLGVIKGVGQAAIESILDARNFGGAFKNIYDFCERVSHQKVNKKVMEALTISGAFDSSGNHRAQLLSVLDQAIEMGVAKQEDINSGQINLFDSVSNDKSETKMDHFFPKVMEWPARQRLAKEKEVLGFYITGHPLEQCQDKIVSLANVNTGTLLERQGKREVILGGIVNRMRETLTRKGDRMAFVTFEDLKGTVEVIVFSDLFAKVSDLLHTEEPLILKGNLEASEDGVKIIATDILPLTEAHKRETKKVHIAINRNRTSQEDLVKVKHVLNKHRGTCSAYLYFKDQMSGSSSTMALDDSIRLAPTDELVKELEGLLGPNSVKFS